MKAVLLLVLFVAVAYGRIFDYVVVGAGTGGSALAKRLSDPIPGTRQRPSVLVLEAGYNQINNPSTQNFKIGYSLQKDPLYSFYHLGASVNALGGRRLEYPPARMWGGTTNVNGALWVRGNEYDSKVYQKYGGSAWSHANNIVDFKAMENFTAQTDCSACHGYSGEVDVIDQAPTPSPVWETFRDAVLPEFPGLGVIQDYNGLSQEGIFRQWQITVQNRTSSFIRESAATAFLQDSVDSSGEGIGRRNIKIISNAYVTRLIFQPNTTKVIRVEYINEDGLIRRARVGKEVHLAAGTIGTPAILLRSGVGPCAELAAIGIPCVVNSSYVGKNVQEHGLMQLIFETPESLVNTVNAYNNAPDSNGFIFGGWAHSPYSSYFADPTLGAPPPDVELNWKVASLYGGEINNLYNLNNFNPINFTPRSKPVISLGMYQMKPICRGYVTLANESPSYAPRTYFCFGDTRLNGSSVDIAYNKWVLQTALQIVRNMQTSDPGWKPLFPTPEMIDDPVLLDRAVRAGLLSGWHPVGSTRMGAFNDVQQGVVDGASLCVHGAQNIRVADNSIFPEAPTGNTQAWAYLAGVRAAKFARAGACPVV